MTAPTVSVLVASADTARLRAKGDNWELLASRCVNCRQLAYPVALACSICGAECAVEAVSNHARAIVATQVAIAREDVAISVPYQIVLARIAEDVVVRVSSLEDVPWAAGEAGELIALPLVARGVSQLGLQFIRESS